jgi:hypothetical protein
VTDAAAAVRSREDAVNLSASHFTTFGALNFRSLTVLVQHEAGWLLRLGTPLMFQLLSFLQDIGDKSEHEVRSRTTTRITAIYYGLLQRVDQQQHDMAW